MAFNIIMAFRSLLAADLWEFNNMIMGSGILFHETVGESRPLGIGPPRKREEKKKTSFKKETDKTLA